MYHRRRPAADLFSQRRAGAQPGGVGVGFGSAQLHGPPRGNCAGQRANNAPAGLRAGANQSRASAASGPAKHRRFRWIRRCNGCGKPDFSVILARNAELNITWIIGRRGVPVLRRESTHFRSGLRVSRSWARRSCLGCRLLVGEVGFVEFCRRCHRRWTRGAMVPAASGATARETGAARQQQNSPPREE